MADGSSKEKRACTTGEIVDPRDLRTHDTEGGVPRLRVCNVESLGSKIRRPQDKSEFKYFKFLLLIKSPLWWLASNCRTLHWEEELGEAMANDWNQQAQAYLKMAECERG